MCQHATGSRGGTKVEAFFRVSLWSARNLSPKNLKLQTQDWWRRSEPLEFQWRGNSLAGNVLHLLLFWLDSSGSRWIFTLEWSQPGPQPTIILTLNEWIIVQLVLSINCLVVWSVGSRGNMGNVDHCLPKSKVTSWNVLFFCPQAKDIQFKVLMN